MTAEPLQSLPLAIDRILPAVLVGGRSARFGRDKLREPLHDGRPLVLRPIDALRAVFGPRVAIVGHAHPDIADLADLVVPDAYPGAGPIGGIRSALEHHSSHVLVLAGDMPAITPADVLALLAALAASPRALALLAFDGLPHPCCGIYAPAAATILAERMEAGRRSLHDALPRTRTVLVPILSASLVNINRPEDLEPPPEPAGPPTRGRAPRRYSVPMARAQHDASGIESVLQEARLFPPPTPEQVGGPPWLIGSMEEYRRLHARSIDDPEGFWADAARQLHWFRTWDRVLDWDPPDARWFIGGRTNLCYNAVDRHVAAGRASELAILWEGEPIGHGGPEIRRITYGALREEVCRFANVLRSMGVGKGDVVTIYMGMVPELAVAVLACARIGAPHSVIFGGFSSQAIVDRVLDARSRIIVTCDGAWRRGKVVPLKENTDAAVAALAAQGHPVDHVIVLNRCGVRTSWDDRRDRDWHVATAAARPDCPCEPMDSEDVAFMLYTSGSTGKPKGIVHTVGGYMVHTALTARYVFNLVPGAGQLFWCTADVGWITGHSYILYGILPCGVPTLMYEGAPNAPTEDRFWSIIARHRVTHFYTAPTAIRAFMKWGSQHPAAHDLTSLQVLGSVGEPINPEAWMWYRAHIGRNVCPIVDTWWQTETGGHMITPLPGVTPTKPGSCTLPFFGVDAAIMDELGRERPANAGGLLGIRRPWPSMLRAIHGDRPRFIETYFSKFKLKDPKPSKGGMPAARGKRPAPPAATSPCSPFYFTGDGARRDADGYFWIMGRVDDVINVSGHRLGTMEVESALVSHPAVVEAAVVGMPHDIKGTGVAAFCTLSPSHEPASRAAADDLKRILAEHVAKEIGAIARPDQIRFTPALPKTRSGKIMRRLLRAIAAGEEKITQDTTTLEDYSVLARLKESEES